MILSDETPDLIARDFRWSNIKPSQSLQYTPCFGSYQCARLSVPLNWNASLADRKDGPRVAVAIIKLPAKVPVTDPLYGGPVIINPGGPGESGIYQMLSEGQNIQTILDSPVNPADESSDAANSKYFDILSFDPRGVNNTTPGLHCFPSAFNQDAWLRSHTDYGLLWDSDSVVGMEWARATALGTSCSQEEAGKEILRFANTPQVVEDIVEIIEREGEWRAAESRKLVSAKYPIHSAVARATLEKTAHHPGQEKLQYWGASYGTIIGSTFAALHPDRVKRVVLDGVVDPADHYSGRWMTQLQDSDQIITELSRDCFESGPEKCALYTGSSAADVEERFASIMAFMRHNPISVVLPTAIASVGETILAPDIITYGDIHLYLLSGMYFPFAMAEELFNLLASLERRNTTSPDLVNLVAMKQAFLNEGKCHQFEPLDNQDVPYVSQMGSFQSISCMDGGGGPTNMTREDFTEYLQVLRAQGRWISPSWARNKLVCLGHDIAPAWRPDFDFETQQWENTSHPLLIIGNSHDTVTPLRNARRVGTLFPGSVVLQQNSDGHCSHSMPSLCTGKLVREYFQTGALPHRGTVCEPEYRPFVGCAKMSGCHLNNDSERGLWEAMVELADPFGLAKKTSHPQRKRLLQRLTFGS
jgi:pimeloyl-ACP methyl ester carboxylesterase